MGRITLPMILPENLPAQAGFHTPVLLPRVMEGLDVKPGKKYIDATLGGGGYTDEILKLGGIVLGIDQDQDAIDFVRQKYQINKDIFLEHGNFRDLKEIAHSYGFNQVAGILFDLGMSSYQLEKSGRGFSYQGDEPLDMRMDKNLESTAADIINKFSKEQLYEIFTKYAEELNSRAIAQAVTGARSLKGEISTTRQLSVILNEVLEKLYRNEKVESKHRKIRQTKARIFQALRIKVNYELENLETGLTQAIELLEREGRVIVLSYHSLEDRLVKFKFKKYESQGLIKIITRKPIIPGESEIFQNPRARSAKLRIAQKLIHKL